MIDVVARMGHGRFELTVDGHAPTEVCAAVTAFQQSAVIWFEQLAELAPTAVRFTLSQED